MPRVPAAAKPFHVDADVSKAETLPAEAFTDPAFLRRELDTVFARSWHLVPPRSADELRADPRSLADLLKRRGAHAPVHVLDRPLFLQRDWKGKLHAFPNVCTHAWHTLVQGPGRDRSITCPQHGRQFDAEGHCLSQPGFGPSAAGAPRNDRSKDFPREHDHLRDLPTEEWDDLFFVAPGGTPAARFDDVLGPVRETVAGLPFDRLERMPAAGEVRELDGNWKQHAWNYLDSMHIPFIHRKPGGLADAVDMASYRTELHPHGVLQWAYAKDPEHGFAAQALPARFRDGKRRVFALWWFVFPDLTLNFYPWGLSINVYQPVPERPRRTLFHWYHFAWDAKKYEAREKVWMMREVDDEDVDALRQTSRGAASGYAPRGRFQPEAETGPHWFHRKVYETVFGA